MQFSMPNKQELVHLYIKIIFDRHGVPEKIMLDIRLQFSLVTLQ